MKKYIIILMAASIFCNSCQDFLDEEMISTITAEYFTSEKGLDQLINGTYFAWRWKYNYVDGAFNFEMGTDIGWEGNWNWSTFNVQTWNPTGAAASQINALMGSPRAYPGINDCNLAIKLITDGTVGGNYEDTKFAAGRLAEARINRARWLYMLTTMLGDTYMGLEPNQSAPSNNYYPKSSSEAIYRQMISDLRHAFDVLPETQSERGRHTRYSAAHFLAKLYLQRAQAAGYQNSSETHLKKLYKGNVATDLDSSIYFATQVIESGQFELEPDYWGLFDVKTGDYASEKSREIILAANYGVRDSDNGYYSMRSQNYFTSDYVQALWGIPARTWTYGCMNAMEITGYRPSDFAYDVFTNKLADSRFEKSFRIEYKSAYITGDSKGTPELPYWAYDAEENETQTWLAEDAAYFNANILPAYNRTSWGGRLAVENQHKIGTDDLGLVFLENTKATAITLQEAKAQPYMLWARWIYDQDNDRYYYRRSPVDRYAAINTGLEFPGSGTVAGSRKMIDPNRAQTNSQYGTRNVPVFRLAETFLVRAEAYGRRDGVTDAKAIADINRIRTRAAYKPGEVRAEVLARLYPGAETLQASERQYPYTVVGSKTGDMLVDAGYWDGASANSEAEMYPGENTTGMSDELFRFVNFIHNEYAREMNTEYTYYEAIHHAGTQADRIMYHYQFGAPPSVAVWDVADNVVNGQGQTGKGKGSFQPFHTFRPFPQTFLNMLTDENNVLLTPEAKQAYQNPGYN